VVSKLTDNEFRLFRGYIEEKCGIEIPDEKSYLIETRLSKILADSGLQNFEELYAMIMKNFDYHISEKVIDAITTNETFWFRDKANWVILENLMMPKFIESIRKGQKTKDPNLECCILDGAGGLFDGNEH
jgi:chemotaxis protein methyltransferase CheR